MLSGDARESRHAVLRDSFFLYGEKPTASISYPFL